MALAVFGYKTCMSPSSTSSFDLSAVREPVKRMKNQLIKLCVLLGFTFTSLLASPTNISAPPISENSRNHSKENLKYAFGHCLHKKDVVKCLKRRVVDVIDDVTQSNDPLSAALFNLELSLNKNPEFKEKSEESDSSRSFDFEDVLSQKLKKFIESRLISVRMLGDTKNDVDHESSKNLDEARKKKGGGGKHGMMMSGNISNSN